MYNIIIILLLYNGGDLISSHVVGDPCNKHTGNGTHVVGGLLYIV